MLGMAGATSLFTNDRLQKSHAFVGLVLVLISAGRAVLVLPFCEQPRFEMAGLHWPVGILIVVIGLVVTAGPVLVVRWWEPPKKGMVLRTTGVYGVVRHPIYLFEVLWPLGLAVMFRSVYGVGLTVVWWAAFMIHALAEEANMERVLGDEYLEYKRKVRGRIFPWVPI
jgi:protein-S-isoprenylcysteine O-methyltransferase Ste14